MIHLGDYIYDFANARYGDGSRPGATAPGRRSLRPSGLSQPLRDLSQRHRSAGRPSPPPVHRRLGRSRSANDAWSGGAGNHNTADGDWTARFSAAYRAYLEWMPIRESQEAGIHSIDRSGSAICPTWSCWTRVGCATTGAGERRQGARDPTPSLLGAAQEAWLFDQLRASQRAGSGWRILGQQILFSTLSFPGLPVGNPDLWDGYPAAGTGSSTCSPARRHRRRDFHRGHSRSWAFDVPRNPFNGYDPTTGAGSVAVEFVTPAISSPPFFASAELRERAAKLRPLARHLKFLQARRMATRCGRHSRPHPGRVGPA